MLLLSVKKAGLWTTLVLLLLGVSLSPVCGRPSFEDSDPLEDEDHGEDEDKAEDQDEDENGEENDSDSRKFDGKECDDLKDQAKTDCLLIVMFELQAFRAAEREKAKQSSTSGSGRKTGSKQDE